MPNFALLSTGSSVMSSPSKIIFPFEISYTGLPITTFARVDLPEPFGPIIAWTSPGLIFKSTPFKISTSSTSACKFLISNICT